jgi:ABC-type phosphate transport system substrate-binding protein
MIYKKFSVLLFFMLSLNLFGQNDTENEWWLYLDDNENIDLFIEWILSRQGQTLISKTRYIPIKIEL